MTRPTLPRSVSSFAPELLALWLTGARQLHEVPDIGDWRDFIKIRQRLYSLRYVARETGHDAYNMMMRAKISWRAPEGCEMTKTRKGEKRPVDGVPITLVISPMDNALAAKIAASGVELDLANVSEGPTPEPPLSIPHSDPGPPRTDDDFLSVFMEEPKP